MKITTKFFSISVISFGMIIGVLYYGQKHLEAVSAIQAKEARSAWEQELIRREERKIAEINKYKPNGNPRSVIDDLYYMTLTQGEVKIATFGSSVTNGDGASGPEYKWANLLIRYIQGTDGLRNTALISNGFPGHSTEMIILQNYVNNVIEAKPHIILFETFVLNDYGQSIPLQKTRENLESMLQKIKEALPQAKVIVLSPNPKKGEAKNSTGAYYKDYVAVSEEFAAANKLDYIDIYSRMMEVNSNINAFLADNVHPNNVGYRIWFDIVKAYFEQKK
ncbi:SGNH/GDSL hydrolase family protein [Paenibacillus sp. MZ04-78.2]|uniref:SGNH/GDSL hydrolase family protein n=1 Tax=Paenibacillus sp. MZ04-78.2 TaxID=2962034 RepID=UPI0020B6633A|nr:SGNH/GDSL hydrolase family protein [Paenibacillus sp. MZ04-78.2]MCP3773453.1 SGNH/GDSL hydrolase family protein [Paenibacillus sp. MZ04-78.2]